MSENIKIDTSDAGLAANAIARAAILYGRIAGMQAENSDRLSRGLSLAWDQYAFEGVIADVFPEYR